MPITFDLLLRVLSAENRYYLHAPPKACFAELYPCVSALLILCIPSVVQLQLCLGLPDFIPTLLGSVSMLFFSIIVSASLAYASLCCHSV